MGAAFNPWGFSLSMKCAGNVKCARGNGYARGEYLHAQSIRTTRIIPVFSLTGGSRSVQFAHSFLQIPCR